MEQILGCTINEPLKEKKMMEQKIETIEFPKSVKKLFVEIIRKHQRELNETLRNVYDELNILERLEYQEQTGEKFVLKSNYSGVDIIIPTTLKKVEKEGIK